MACLLAIFLSSCLSVNKFSCNDNEPQPHPPPQTPPTNSKAPPVPWCSSAACHICINACSQFPSSSLFFFFFPRSSPPSLPPSLPSFPSLPFRHAPHSFLRRVRPVQDRLDGINNRKGPLSFVGPRQLFNQLHQGEGGGVALGHLEKNEGGREGRREGGVERRRKARNDNKCVITIPSQFQSALTRADTMLRRPSSPPPLPPSLPPSLPSSPPTWTPICPPPSRPSPSGHPTSGCAREARSMSRRYRRLHSGLRRGWREGGREGGMEGKEGKECAQERARADAPTTLYPQR